MLLPELQLQEADDQGPQVLCFEPVQVCTEAFQPWFTSCFHPTSPSSSDNWVNVHHAHELIINGAICTMHNTQLTIKYTTPSAVSAK